jgi:methylmalonyl-CoA/ethylmalonyl-CoA epimerase
LFQEFLVRRGTGVHDLTTHVMEPAAFDAALPELRRNGIGIRQTLKIEDTLDIHYLDTIGQLATTLKVLVPHRPGGEKLEGVPIETELRFATPAANERLPVEQAYHVCINTRHRRLSVQEGFRRLFGIEDWFEFDNESNVTVRDVHYLGNPTDGRFRLICGRRQQFSVEIVEMIFGDSGYQEMLDTKGEGIHHVFTTVCTLERLDEAKRALARDGYTIVQDGANGAIYYGYLGAPGKLAGLNVEMLCPLSDDWTAGADDGFWQILLGSGYQSHPLIGR